MQLRDIYSVLPVLAWATSEGPMADLMVVARARAFDGYIVYTTEPNLSGSAHGWRMFGRARRRGSG